MFKDKTADFKQAIEGKNIYDKEKGTGFAQMDTDLELFEEMAKTDRNLLKKFIDAIRDLIARIKGYSNLEQDLKYLEERLARVYESADNKKTATESGGIEFYNDVLHSKDSKFVIDAIKENAASIPDENVFFVKNEVIPPDIKKSDYVLKIFESQGKIAINKNIGKVELARSGAKSTVFHGFGPEKLAATRAIKNVIENGTIIKKTTNYNGSDVDRYVIAAKGEIDNRPAYIGVIIKTYPKQKNSLAKFYLHEAVIIKMDSPIMTAPQLSVDAVSESTTNNIPNSVENVKQKQLDIILKTNPAPNTYQTWVRSTDDIHTWDEVLKLDDEREGQFVWGDFSREDAEQALKDGTITIYSSYPIENGVFVSTSKIQSQEYAGGKNGKVYSKTVPLDNVAWINGDEGQYAVAENIDNESFSSDNLDTEYLKAVENNDMETAQRLVDEAAKEAGYPVKGYHGTGEDFNIFSEDKISGRNVWGKGYYFGTSKGIADDYASFRASKGGKYRIVNAALKMDNPFTPHKSSIGTAKEILDTWFPDMWKNSKELGLGYIQGKLDNSPLDLLQFIAEHNNIEVRDVLKKYGYDSIKDGGELVVFDSNQIKSADPVTYDDNGNVVPLSERFNENEVDIRYSSDDLSVVQKQLLDRYENGELTSEEYLEQSGKLWIKANEEYGSLPQGEKAQLNMPVPQKVAEDKPTERFVRTIIETDSLNGDMLEGIEERVLLGDFSYKVISDEKAIKTANRALENKTANTIWDDTVSSGKRITKNQIAIGEKLLENAIKNGDTFEVLKLSAELADIFTRAGQVVQSARLLKKMTGAGRLVSLQRTVKTINKDLRTKYGEDYPPIKISEESAKRLAEAKTASGVEYAYQNILQEVADQMPSTFLDKWNAWRYFAMLSNPKTHIRNLLGNALFIPAVRIKDALASGMELTVSQDKRTKSLVIKKEYSDFAKRDAELQSVKNLLKGNKYNDKTAIREKQKIFKTEALNFLTEFNSNALEAEDMLFKNIHYIHALAGYLQARKANLSNISEEMLWEARTYAVKEAKKATFNDESALANAVQRFGNKNLVSFDDRFYDDENLHKQIIDYARKHIEQLITE